MRPFAALLALLCLPAPARAGTPVLVRGPAIVGVSSERAFVSWETSEKQSPAALLLGTAPGQHPLRVEDRGLSESHHVVLDGLAPGTRYWFVIDSDPAQQESSFRTAPAPAPLGQAGPVRFVVYGDNRTDAAAHQSVVDAIRREAGVDFLVHTGDMAQNYPTSQEWDVFFSVEHDLLRSTPFFPALGNHETLDTLVHWGRFFAFPGFNQSQPVRYYGADWGPVHLAVLDSYDSTIPAIDGDKDSISAAQMEWLKADLDAARRRGAVPFVALHRGAYSHASGPGAHGGSALVRAQVMPELQARGVLAVFAGHDHIHERGCHGDVDSFVAGGGGAPLYSVDAGGDPGVLFAKAAHSYTVIDVKGRAVTGVTKAPDGTVLDTFSLPTPGCDHGQLEAGAGGAPDGGSDGGPDAGAPPAAPPAASGCSSGGPATLLLLAPLLLALGLRRRAKA